MVYVINLILICAYWFILNAINLSSKNRKKIFLTICAIQFTIIVGTRTIWTGVDTNVYYSVFERLRSSDTPFAEWHTFEIFYAFLAWMIARLGGGFVLLNIIMAAMTMFFLSKAIYKLSSSVFFSIYAFVSFCLLYQMLNQYRQILALAIVLYAISYLLDGNKKAFLIWVVLAAGFHKSSLVAIPLMFLPNIKITSRLVWLYVISAVVLWFLNDLLFYMISLTPYGGYIGGVYDQGFLWSTVLNLGVRICVLIFCGVFHKRLVAIRSNIDFFYHLALICTVLQVLTVKSALYGRVTTYFFAGYLILLPEIAANGCSTRRNKLVVNIGLYLVLLAWHIVYYTSVGGFGYAGFVL